MATADSGASGIYITTKDKHILTNTQPDTPSTTTLVQAAEGSIMSSTATGNLTFKGLPHTTFQAKVFDTLDSSLVGVGTIIDQANVKALLSAEAIHFINQQGDIVLTGPRCPTTGLWNIDLNTTTVATHATTKAKGFAVRPLPMDSVGDLIAWWHASFGFPAASTFLRALSSWLKDKIPGVSYERAKKHKQRLQSITSAKGHLNQTRKNARSTKETTPRIRTNKDNIIVHLITDTERNDMDIAHLLHDKYLMVFYSQGGNYIHIELLDATTEQHVLRGYKHAVTFFESHGLKPNIQRMDNYSSFLAPAFTEFQASQDITVDRVPPGQHRRNKAERCIETAKHHIIATLAGTDPAFPMSGVKRLMFQIELTLNLLRPARKEPNMSAWEQLHGIYDFNAHPLGPMGCRVLSHDKPDARESWGVHGTEGFYVGPTLDHYRCYNVLISSTNRIRTTDTISWHPEALSTKSSCSLTRLRGDMSIITRSITAISKADITVTNQVEFNTLCTQLAQVQRTLESKLTAAATEQRVSPMTTPTSDHSASNTTANDVQLPTHGHDLPPVVAESDTHIEPAIGPSEPPPTPCDQRVTPVPPTPSPTIPRATPTKQSKRGRKGGSDSLQTITVGAATARKLKRRQHQPDPIRQAKILSAKQLTRKNNTQRRKFLWQATRYYAATAVDLDEEGRKLVYHNAIKGPHRDEWERAAAEEIIRLFDSSTGKLIHMRDIPKGRRATYYNPRCRIKMKNGELQYRVRGTAGGDKIQYDGDTAAFTASMQTMKIVLNAVVSDPGARVATADIKDYYLSTPLVDKHGNPATEYMRINLNHIPSFVQEKYSMAEYAHSGHVYIEISKTIYGLPQSGRLSQDRLIKHLRAHDYIQCPNTPALFKHKSKNLAFTLVVDDFMIKYSDPQDLDDFFSVLRKQYVITTDTSDTQKYVGITIQHDRTNRKITLSMPGYIDKALARFGIHDAKGANSPAVYTPPKYGAHVQYEELDDTSPATPEAKTRLQEIVGVFLFYARAIDCTMLTTVNKLASKQANPTEDVVAAAHRLMQYAARFPNASVEIRPSNMQLMCHSDASYLSEANSRSRAGGFLFLGDPDMIHGLNGAIDCISVIIKNVVASAAEAEYAALFIVGQEAVAAAATLKDLGYPQQATLIICDNQCAVGIANRTVKQKQSKSIAMKMHWTRDRVDLDELRVEWRPGSENLADYFTKIHPVHHHLAQRQTYIRDQNPYTCLSAS
jgi:hypothetical protein